MNSYINTDLTWTLPTKPFIITQRVISFNNVIYQINTNKTNLLEIAKLVFQFFKFSNIFDFCLMLLFFETLCYMPILKVVTVSKHTGILRRFKLYLSFELQGFMLTVVLSVRRCCFTVLANSKSSMFLNLQWHH